MNRTAVFHHPDMLEHAPDGFDPNRPDWTQMVKERLGDQDEGGMRFTHPERPERLQGLLDSLRQHPIDGLDWYEAQPASRETLSLVHSDAHLDELESYRGRSGWLWHDTTAVSPGSIRAAELAAGASCDAVEAVLTSDHRRSFALVRPPGHHAYADRSRGFCLLNNVAIAVEHARRRHGVRRVLVLDWDTHHGNGTQAFFADDPDVLHVDFHAQSPTYPGGGSLTETGTGRGFGATINVPLPPETGDGIMVEALESILRPRAVQFQPELIIIGAGFDAHRSDLLMNQTEDGFAAMTAQVLELADLLTDGRIAFILEGGYREALAVSVHACLSVMAGASAPEIPRAVDDPGREALVLATRFHNRPIYMAAMAQAAAGSF